MLPRSQSVSGQDSPLIAARAVEPELKRVLYGCFERLKATKASLYLSVTHGEETTYEIVTSYGFTQQARQVVDTKDPIVQRLISSRSPVLINSLAADPHIAEILFAQGNERLLAIPILGRMRRMIGIIDMRDKSGKKPFDDDDLKQVPAIVDAVIEILAKKELYGVGSIPLVDLPQIANKREPAPAPAEAQPAQPERKQETSPESPMSPRAQEAIRAARERMARRGIGTSEVRRRIVTAEELEQARVLLPAVLAIPGVAAAALTSTAKDERQAVVARGTLDMKAMALLHRHINAWLKRPEHQPLAPQHRSFTIQNRNVAVMEGQIVGASTSPVAPKTIEGLILTVAFDTTPDEAVRDQIETFVARFGEAMEAAISRSDRSSQRIVIAEKLLEPDFQKIPRLIDHCRAVSGISVRFARALGLAADVVETVRIAALAHDVGLRLLDYERISQRRRLSAEERRAVAEHPLIGAALVEPLLGSDVAEGVLRHHERWDGRGYPGRIAGNTIPLTARIIQIADAWVAMTSPTSYLPTIDHGDAQTRLRTEAGSQFDPSLVATFLGSLHEIAE
jgi:HD-GYP domain-containing protein (c-di-GMP phosphodiesterase class II)